MKQSDWHTLFLCNCIMWVTHDVFSSGNLAHSRQWRDQDKKTFPPKSLKHLHCHVYNIEFTLSNNNSDEKSFTRYWPNFGDVLILWDQTRGEDYYLQIQCLKLSSETSSYLVGSVTRPYLTIHDFLPLYYVRWSDITSMNRDVTSMNTKGDHIFSKL